MAANRTKKRPGFDRRYDLPMIRDFLDHLLWEVRISHHEMQTQVGSVNPELAEQLAKYIKKRQTFGLLFTTATKERPADNPAGVAKLKRVKGNLREAQLEALELLHTTLFPEAFDAAKLGMVSGVMQFETFDHAARFWGQGQDVDRDDEDDGFEDDE